jgi:HlyD family secretion protein
MKIILALLSVLAIVLGGAFYYTQRAVVKPSSFFRTTPVQRDNLLCTISATGTLEPEELVNVGAQVAGLITGFGKDIDGKRVDYNSVVEKDADLAYIDQASYQATFDQAEASLAKSHADLMQYEAKLEQTKQEWKRAQVLRPQNAIAETDFDTAHANYKVAEANVDVAKAVIKQNEALLRVAKTNLGYTTIKSPVRGTVIDRRVNIGQTVVASLNAPSIFLIAKDLRKMQVWVSVNEADIGRICVGMPVQFTVDAHPNDTFHGAVAQIRMNATMTSNVVNYTVVVTADNPDGKLFPYLTASVLFEVDNRPNVLVVPNAALRWKPKSSQIASTAANTVATSGSNKTADKKEPPCVWVVADDGKFVRPIRIAVGPTDGILTEISGEGIKTGTRVVIGEGGSSEDAAEETAGADEEKPNNPFLPKFPKGHKPPPPPG